MAWVFVTDGKKIKTAANLIMRNEKGYDWKII